MELDEAGMLLVTETIEVDFSRSDHGITRKLPFKFQVDMVEDELPQGRGEYGTYYTTFIEDIEVKDEPFEVSPEEGYQVIRIGAPDEYVVGNKTYVITYKVFGVLNHFDDFVNLNWDITGDKWETDIALVEFSLKLPHDLIEDQAEVELFTGYRYEPVAHEGWLTGGKSIIEGSIEEGVITGQYAALTVKLPKDYIPYAPIPVKIQAENYVIEQFDCKLKVLADGRMHVTEEIRVEFQGPVYEFIRTLEHEPNYLAPPVPNLYYEFDPQSFDTWTLDHYAYGPQLSSRPDAGFFEREHTFVLKYTVFGGTRNTEAGTEILWFPFGTGFMEPIREANLSIEIPEGHFFTQNGEWEIDGVEELSLPAVDPVSNVMTLQLNNLMLQDQIRMLTLPITPTMGRATPPPTRLSAESYFFKHYHILMRVDNNGTIQFKHEIQPEALDPNNGYYFNAVVPTKYRVSDIEDYYFDQTYHELILLPKRNVFGRDYKPLVTEPVGEGGHQFYKYYNGYNLDWSSYGLEEQHDKLLSFEYDVTGLLADHGLTTTFPITQNLYEPAQSFSLRVEFPADATLIPDDYELWIATPEGKEQIELQTKDNVVSLAPIELFPDSKVFVTLGNPGQKMSFGNQVKLIWQNNIWLFIPLFFLLPFGLIWFLWRWDAKNNKWIHHYPPAQLTSAEAGILADEIVQDQDLVSLLYYWAARGIIKIKAITGSDGSRDYELTQLKPIPSSAKGFERIMLERIFRWTDGTDCIRVSKLKGFFSSTLTLARNDLEAHTKKNEFAVKETRGIGLVFKIAAGVGGLLATIAFFGVVTHFDSDYILRYDIPIGILLSSCITLVFGFLMPKQNKYGSRSMKDLMGFTNFLKTAEQREVEKLIQEKPDYFSKTLSFAIALGLPIEWGQKFTGLSLSQPKWYQDDQMAEFDPASFSKQIAQSAQHIHADFSAQPNTPPPPPPSTESKEESDPSDSSEDPFDISLD